jgi:hypothetical protein
MKCSKDTTVKVLEAVTMMSTVFWDVTSCRLLEVYRRFGLAYCLHLQVRRVSRASKEAAPAVWVFDLFSNWSFVTNFQIIPGSVGILHKIVLSSIAGNGILFLPSTSHLQGLLGPTLLFYYLCILSALLYVLTIELQFKYWRNTKYRVREALLNNHISWK